MSECLSRSVRVRFPLPPGPGPPRLPKPVSDSRRPTPSLPSAAPTVALGGTPSLEPTDSSVYRAVVPCFRRLS